MSTFTSKDGQMWRTAVRLPVKLHDRLLDARERESERIGIDLSEAAIVRKAIELGLAQMEKVR